MSGVSPSGFSHLPVNVLSDDDEAEPPRNGLKRGPVTSLDILAKVATQEKKQRVADADPVDADPFEKCSKFMDIFCDGPPEIDEFFQSVCQDLLVDDEEIVEALHLRKKFTLQEMCLINAVFEWFHLLNFGCLFDEEEGFSGVEGVKRFAGVNSLAELLSTSKTEGGAEGHLSLQGLLNLLRPFRGLERPPQEPSHRFIYLLADIIQDLAATDEILSTFNLSFQFKDEDRGKKFVALFDGLPFEERVRITLLINILARWAHDEGQQSRVCSELERTHSLFPSELQPLIASIQASIEGGQKMPLWEGFAVKDLFVPQGAFAGNSQFARLDLPGFPNWMPNGGNSCYISSTVWGVFFLMDGQVRARLEQFDQAPRFELQTSLMNQARAAFARFYRKVAAEATLCIGRDEVNAFRLAVQSALPEQFAPKTVTQEDACDFLVALVNEVLELNPRSQGAPKFSILHTFGRATEEPLIEEGHYNYQEALAPYYSPQLSYILDVRLDEIPREKTSLKELVTTSRATETVERNAYKIGDFSGPKYRSIQAHHREHFLVESREAAPQLFVGRLTRFSWDFRNGIQKKRFDPVLPNATLKFHLRGRETEEVTVPYDLVAVSVHSGDTIHAGHYYTYIRKQVEGVWRFVKYDDIAGVSICLDDKLVMRDASTNGYIFYYKKREDGAHAPAPLPFEDSEELQEKVQRDEIPNLGKEPSEEFLEGIDYGCLFDTPFSSSQISHEHLTPSKAVFAVDSEFVFSSGLEMALPSVPLFESPLPFAYLDSKEAASWMGNTHLENHFYIPEQDGFFRDLSELFLYFTKEAAAIKSEQEALEALGDFLKRPVYLIDLEKDRDLYVLDEQFPIPGDRFRICEHYSGDPFYLFRQTNGTFVILNKKG